MQNKSYVLGIDTSNYTTSLALTDQKGNIIADSRKLLTVKHGERGLRQSTALFQHMENLPQMLLDLYEQHESSSIVAVAASSRPRPVQGSYMPVFKAGMNYGKVMAASLRVPFFEYSHQEGHLEAVRKHSPISKNDTYLAYHMSGGTTELLAMSGEGYRLIGGTKDISFGQVLDRIGVLLGMTFPAGRELDQIAVSFAESAISGFDTPMNSKNQIRTSKRLKNIPLSGLTFNLSGIETQCTRAIEKGEPREELIYELFLRISESLSTLTKAAMEETGIHKTMMTGGVASSCFVRNYLNAIFSENIVFGEPKLSSDNAVGISYLGGEQLWR